MSFSLLMGELPHYLETIGGADKKGLILGFFTLAALLGRIFSGKLADLIGRKPMVFIGCVVSVISGFGYLGFATVSGFLIIRFIHGFSTGFAPTGATAMLADMVPSNRRGEAMGVLGFCIQLGMAIGPYMGSEAVKWVGMDGLFMLSGGLAAISLASVASLKETLHQPLKFSIQMLRIHPAEIFEPRVLRVMVVMVTTVFLYGATMTVLPDYCQHLGFSNKSTFTLIYTLSTLFIRIFAGRISDRFGRKNITVLGCALELIASAVLMVGVGKTSVIAAGILYGVGGGILSPVLFAWAVDVSDDAHRARALSSIYIAMELGIGLGALVAAGIFKNEIGRIPLVFAATTLSLAVATIAAVVKDKSATR